MISCMACNRLANCIESKEFKGVIPNADVNCEKFRPIQKLHKIKLDYNFCDDVYSGRKNFEIRENDRLYQTGDLVSFTPFNSPNSVTHLIRDKLYEITYVASGFGIKEGWVVFGIKEVKI